MIGIRARAMIRKEQSIQLWILLQSMLSELLSTLLKYTLIALRADAFGTNCNDFVQSIQASSISSYWKNSPDSHYKKVPLKSTEDS
jgi:hypothetical protein